MTATATPDLRALRARADALGYTISHRTELAELEEHPGTRALFVQITLTPATAAARARLSLSGKGDSIIGEAAVDPSAQSASRHAAARLAEEAAARALAEALRLHDATLAPT